MKDFDGDVEWRVTDELVTIADYRRWFNDYYCEKVDVLMWGETDALIPKQTFQILDNLHNNVKDNTPKYTTFCIYVSSIFFINFQLENYQLY